MSERLFWISMTSFEKSRSGPATATKQLNPSKHPDNNRKRLDKAMAKLLKNYPPPSKS
jgi:hypothetical protein